MADEPHPTAQELIALADAAPVPGNNGLTPTGARDRFEQLTADLSVEPVETVETYPIPGPEANPEGIPVRVYEPTADPPYPLLVYYHGGGFTVGSLDTHDNVCAALTNRADCLTVSVDYRLAPEHPFPAALEDCYAALEWAADFADDLDADADRLAVAGDSAGGTLSAAVALMARDLDGPDLVHQGLIYPATASSATHEFPSYEENAEGYFLEMDAMEWYYDNYIQSPVHAQNPYASPLVADDLADLPPATVITAGFDPLRDEGRAYAERLADAGVDTDHLHYEEMIHGFVSLPEFIPRGADATDDLAERLAEAFGA